MGSIGAPEVVIVLLIALIFLGPDRLPGAARSLGKAVGEFRRVTGGIQAEMRDVVDDVMRSGGADHDTSGERAADTPSAPAPVGSTTEGASRPDIAAAAELPPPPADPSQN